MASHFLNIQSRLFLGTANYPSLETLLESVEASETEIVTVSLRREAGGSENFWKPLRERGLRFLPNTAGCRSAREAITVAEMAREIFDTHWIKLEVIGEDSFLQPDPFALVEAAEILIQKGFEVFPYMTDDLVVAKRLVDVGCRILMPWGSPIGSGRGIQNPQALQRLRNLFPQVFLVVDAGIGKPSHACAAMELGADAVLLNTAVAEATHPAEMAAAFRDAVRAGHLARRAGTIAERVSAKASTPEMGKPFWQQELQ